MDAVREDFRQYIDALLKRLALSAIRTNVDGRRERFFASRSFHRFDLTPHVRWPGARRGHGKGQASDVVLGARHPKGHEQPARTYSLDEGHGRALAATQIAMDCKEAVDRVRVARKLLAIVEWVELHDTADDVRPRLKHRLLEAIDRPCAHDEPDEEWRSEWAMLGLGG